MVAASARYAAPRGAGMAMEDLRARSEVLVRAWRLDPEAIVLPTEPPTIAEIEEMEWPVYTGKGRPPVFVDALKALDRRVPVAIRPAWRRTAQEVSRLYVESGDSVVAAVNAADVATSKTIKRHLGSMLEEGKSLAEATKDLKNATKDGTRSCSETFRPKTHAKAFETLKEK